MLDHPHRRRGAVRQRRAHRIKIPDLNRIQYRTSLVPDVPCRAPLPAACDAPRPGIARPGMRRHTARCHDIRRHATTYAATRAIQCDSGDSVRFADMRLHAVALLRRAFPCARYGAVRCCKSAAPVSAKRQRGTSTRKISDRPMMNTASSEKTMAGICNSRGIFMMTPRDTGICFQHSPRRAESIINALIPA